MSLEETEANNQNLPQLGTIGYNESLKETFMTSEYKYLKPKPGSNYRQLFVGRIKAEVLLPRNGGPRAAVAGGSGP